MRAIMVMYDTLCRRYLPPYGCDWVHAPNFARLAQRTVQFQNCYIGSMPCMPARREIHTGRYNFLHRSWGPLEPFDDSMPEQLSRAGTYTYKVTDHHHYWEDGGATYHNRYHAYDFIRGQEGDRCRAFAGKVVPPPNANGIQAGRIGYIPDHRTQDWVNRQTIHRDEDMPQHLTFSKGLDFIERSKDEDNWFCQIETFDPHEPFHVLGRWKELYKHDWDESFLYDWPKYERCADDEKTRRHIRCTYAALVSFCDAQLGRVLDLMDAQDMWKDTMLIVNTDHGFLLGEHDWWAKCRMPFWQEVAHLPLWVWDPRLGHAGQRRDALVQTIDIAPTLLEFFGQPIPKDCMGVPLRQVIERDAPVRRAGLFGIHGGHVNVTDGRFVYMRGPAGDYNGPLHQYTIMPTHMRSRCTVEELQNWQQHPGFPFTKGVPVMRFGSGQKINQSWISDFTTRLYDLSADYTQEHPIADRAHEARMLRLLVEHMAAAEAPPEQYERLGLPTPDRLDDAAIAAACRC